MLNSSEIKNCERAHYFMQLSSYFSELADFRGVSFACSDLVSDTWYNQAYNLHMMDPEELMDCDAVAKKSHDYFVEKGREACFYLTDADAGAAVFENYLRSNGYVVFDNEAWMFFDMKSDSSIGENASVRVVDVQGSDLPVFEDVYRRTLPGPEVEAYIRCVDNGFRARLPLIDTHYFLAYVDGRAVGMASVLSMGEYSGVYAVAVEESFRGIGVCRTLMSKVVAIARQRNARYLFLQTGADDDSAKIFEKLGFVTKFIRRGYISQAAARTIEHG